MIDRNEALALLERAVQEKGEDFVYTQIPTHDGFDNTACAYFHGDKPSCIVGHVLHYAGVTADDIESHNFDERVGVLNLHLGLFTVSAEVALAAAQDTQDGGATWGYALRRAQEA